MKKHGRSTLKTLLLTSLFALCTSTFAEIDPQLVKMNLQIKSKKSTHKSELAMPFYQKAEFLKNDYLIELNPKRGKNKDEILLGYKVLRAKNGRSVKSGEAVISSSRSLNISAKGLNLKVAPVL